MLDRVPVDPGLAPVDEAGLEEIEEHLLFVAVIVGIAGGELPPPVVGEAHLLQLPAHRRDVVAGPGERVHPVLDRRVFRRKAEGVPAHRMQDIEALGALEPGDNVAEGVVADVPHVDPARRVGEHLKYVIFRTARIGLDPEGLPLLPDPLPFRFGLGERVTGHGISLGASARPAARRDRPQPACSVSKRSWRARVRIASSMRVSVPSAIEASCQPPLPSCTWRKTATRTPSARRLRERM